MVERSLDNVQAVVFAGGYGNRMMNLTEQMPKLLLPIANVPMYWYTLNLLTRNGIQDVILITNALCDSTVRKALKNEEGELPSLPGTLNVDVVCFNTAVEEYGTADVLRLISHRLKADRDLLLVSGDIVSDFLLDGMFKFHCDNSSVLTCLFWDGFLNGPVPGPKVHQKKYRDFSALLADSGQLLYLCEEDDFDVDENFDTRLFQTFPKINFTVKYKDCYIYFMNPAILELLKHDEERKFTSVKADLIPYLLKGQYLKTGRKIAEHICNSKISYSTEATNGKDSKQIYTHSCPYRCFAYRSTSSADGTLLAQCNTIATYFETNKAVQRVLKNIFPASVATHRDGSYFKSQKANVSESLIAATSTLAEKATVRRSVIGANCVIGEKVKIENSLLMSGVVVKAGAAIKSSIIFCNVEIGEKTDVNMCIVASEQKLTRGKFANEVIRVEKEMNLND